MVTSLLVFAVLALLTVGIMLVSAAAALPRKRPYDLHMEAEKEGDALLRSWLTPEQDQQWSRAHQFEVIGCDTGKRYRITNSASMNVFEVGQDERYVARWCFAPKGSVPIGDVLLAQKIALETMELQALAVANKHRSPQPNPS